MRSIRSIIFLRLFWTILIFFIVVSGLAYYLTSEAIRQFAVDDAKSSLSFVINNIRSNYTSELRSLDQIARMEGFLPFEKVAAQSVTKKFLQFQNVYSTIHVYGKNGELILAEKRATVPAYEIEPNFNQKKDAAYIAMANGVMAEKKPMASETFFTSSGDLYQTYISPVFFDREGKQILGILSGGVFPRLQKIDHLLEGLKLGKNNFILISDNHGRLIANDGVSEHEIESAVKPQIEEAVKTYFGADPSAAKSALPANSQTQVKENVQVGAGKYILISLPIPELKYVVTVGVNTALIEEKKEQLTHRLSLALILGLLLSLFSSVLLGERLAKPFRDIAETVNKINTGNFAARAKYNKDDEIGYLSGLVNKLAEKIEKSEYLGNLWHNDEDPK